jgi:hypothetical protein
MKEKKIEKGHNGIENWNLNCFLVGNDLVGI